jgi:hypothetical protein
MQNAAENLLSMPLLFHLMSTTDEKKKKENKEGRGANSADRATFDRVRHRRSSTYAHVTSSLVYGANVLETTAVVV